jgi:hypothetical protein
MKKTHFICALCLSTLIFTACAQKTETQNSTSNPEFTEGTFGYDVAFLEKHQETLILKDNEAMIAVVPDYQGRVMTSTAKGMSGMSFGWLNYKLIASGENAPHFNNYGGEERFWLGPEGGQFSVFFKPGVSFTFENWQVPAPIDSEPFELVSKSDTTAIFRKEMALQNYSFFDFKVLVDRTVSIMNSEDLFEFTQLTLPKDISWVGYQTQNKITNTGDAEWTKKSGLLSIWILGQFISSPNNTVIAPFHPGPVEDLGPIVNDTYFGKIAEDRLVIRDSLIFFKADGKQRGKIGLSPARSKDYLGSYDSDQKLLTLVFFNKPDMHEGYVNSMWELQEQPFGGDVVNSYNDGPLEDGSQLGPFYELETSSPAAILKPGQSLSHISTTFHLSGSEESLNNIITRVFGSDLETIKLALSK